MIALIVLALFCGRLRACHLGGQWYDVFQSREQFHSVVVVAENSVIHASCVFCSWKNATGLVNGVHISLTFDGHANRTMHGEVQAGCEEVDWLQGWLVGYGTTAWRRPKVNITAVHLVTMTHLDVGYTNLMPEVLDGYFYEWFPKAYNTSEQLRQRGGEERFVWTTHPWLIHSYLRNVTGNVTRHQLQMLDEAILRGDITWHAGPFNLNSEIADASLYDFGLSLSSLLDAKYDLPPKIALSQKDVPGMTRGVLPLLSARGIKALHVGVNDFSVPPAVPTGSARQYDTTSPFFWRDAATGSQLLCIWGSGYSRGDTAPELLAIAPDGRTALAYIMHTDNHGPPSPTQVLEGYDNLRVVFPHAKIEVSSLGAFAEVVLAGDTASLPVITREIGDVWLRGSASDPLKIRAFREAARMRAAALQSGEVDEDDPRMQHFSHWLLKIAEHTYGLASVPLWHHCGSNFSNAKFDSEFNSSIYQEPLTSFHIQRAVVEMAVAALDELPLRARIERALKEQVPVEPDIDGLRPWKHYHERQACGDVSLQFGEHGGLVALDVHGKSWAAADHPLGRFHYTTHAEAEFKEYISAALHGGCEIDCGGCGFAKCNVSQGGAEASDSHMKVATAFKGASNNLCRYVLKGTLPPRLQKHFGAPGEVSSEVLVNKTSGRVDFVVQYFNKRRTRLPESMWVEFKPSVAPDGWRLDKMGSWVDPLDVVINGSRAMHGVWSGVRHSSGLRVLSPDTPIVSMGYLSPIVFLGSRAPAMENGLFFNLFNNAWSTNYPLWSLDRDGRARFSLVFDENNASGVP